MLIRFAIHVVALLFVFYVIWGVHSRFLAPAIVMALILALVNAVLRPILLVLTLPVTILTLGIFVIVLNALLFALSFWLLQAVLGHQFDVPFARIVLGWLIYVVISNVLVHIV